MAFFDLDPLLEAMLNAGTGISDLNLSVGRSPQVEIDGQLKPVAFAGSTALALPGRGDCDAPARGKRDAADKLVRTGSTDLSYSLAGRTRFRVNIFAQRGTYCVVLRVIRAGSRPSRSSASRLSSTRSRRSATASCW